MLLDEIRDSAAELKIENLQSCDTAKNVHPMRLVLVYIDGMTSPRIPYGTRKNPVTVSLRVKTETHSQLKKLAKHIGVSQAWLFEAMIEHVYTNELDERGYPTWWPTTDHKDGELPIPPA